MSDLDEPRGLLPRMRWWIIAGVTALVVVVLVLVSILGREDSGASPRTPEPAGTDSVCGLPAGDMTGVSEPLNAEWKVTDRVALPFSEGAGPGRTENGVHYCFNKSAAGAILAATFAAADGSSAAVDPVTFVKRRVSRESLGYESALKDAEAGRGGSSEGGLQVAGYRIDSVGDDRATVTIAFRLTQGTASGDLVGGTVALVWEGGDWRVDMPSDTGIGVVGLKSLAGFVEWSGV